MAAREMDTDAFLNHRTSGGGNVAILGKWKDREGDPNRQPVPLPARTVDVWLHTKCGIIIAWRHPWPRRVVKDDKETGESTVQYWGGNLVCREEEEVLRRQRYRNDDGTREAPPVACAVCLFNEWLRGQVVSGAVGWTQPVFKFRGTDSSVILRAGGMYGDFDKKEKTKEELDALAEVGIKLKDAWKETCVAKASYIFRIVDHDHPEAGVQVAVETSLVGDKTKVVIHDKKDTWGKDKGDPRKNPYAIRWQYRPTEVEFGKKYHAVSMDSLQLTQEIRKLITDPPPDVGYLVEPYNARTLYHDMREHCLLKDVPWERFFGPLDNLDAPDDGQAPKAPPPTGCLAQAKAAPAVEMFACDQCDKPMAATAATCPHCGAQYEVEQEAPEPEPPPPPPEPALPKRSAAKKAAAPAAAAAAPSQAALPKRSAKAAPAATPPAEAPFFGGGPEADDDIPF